MLLWVSASFICCYQTSQATATVSLSLLRRAAGPSSAQESNLRRHFEAGVASNQCWRLAFSMRYTLYLWWVEFSAECNNCHNSPSPRDDWLAVSLQQRHKLMTGRTLEERVCNQQAVVLRHISLCSYLQILTPSAFQSHFPSAELRTHLCREKSQIFAVVEEGFLSMLPTTAVL